MKKKIFLFLLAALIMLTCTASAGGSINLYVNGKEVYAPAPPVIINDRVMVPIRFVAEALDCNVTWNGLTNSVFISEKKAVTPPVIEGTAEFKEVIEGVLDLAKQRDPELYNWYISNADVIKLGYADGYVAMNSIDLTTKKTVITFGEGYFNEGKASLSKQDMILIHVGLLAHECSHNLFYDNENVYTPEDAEIFCEIAAVRAIEKVGGKNSYAHKHFKDSVNKNLNF